MNIIANEVRHVERLLKEKRLTERRATKDVRLMVQYYLSKRLTQEATVQTIISFINEVNGNDSGTKWRSTIEGMVKDIEKQQDFKLRQVDKVAFSKTEVETIFELPTEHERKYAWGILLLCKIVNHDKKSKWLTIDKLNKFCTNIGVRISDATRRVLVLHKLKEKGLLNVAKKTGAFCFEVTFIEKPLVSEPYIEFATYNHLTGEENYFKNAMTLYDKLNKQLKTYECEVCKEIVITDKRVQKYCKTCAEEVKRGRVKV